MAFNFQQSGTTDFMVAIERICLAADRQVCLRRSVVQRDKPEPFISK